MRKGTLYFSIGGALCLAGSLCWFLSRKLYSGSFSKSSDNTPPALVELESWKRQVELELATQFDRVKSVLGRIDREKRKSRAGEEQAGDTSDGPGTMDPNDEQSQLNRVLAAKFHGVG